MFYRLLNYVLTAKELAAEPGSQSYTMKAFPSFPCFLSCLCRRPLVERSIMNSLVRIKPNLPAIIAHLSKEEGRCVGQDEAIR